MRHFIHPRPTTESANSGNNDVVILMFAVKYFRKRLSKIAEHYHSNHGTNDDRFCSAKQYGETVKSKIIGLIKISLHGYWKSEKFETAFETQSKGLLIFVAETNILCLSVVKQ